MIRAKLNPSFLQVASNFKKSLNFQKDWAAVVMG